MHPNLIKACAMLQKRIARYETVNHWLTEQAEEALNELVTRPNLTGEPNHLVRNALSNARKKLKRREALMDYHSPNITFGVDRAITDALPQAEFDLLAVINHLPEQDRRLLEFVAADLDAVKIAALVQLPVQRTRERISRARNRARIAWKAAA